MDLRVVASTPGTGGLYRLDPLVASLARRTLWLTDAYFAGTSSYVQALRAAAQDGVDVRLLVPGPGSDIPLMQAVSRAGYRALLEAGVRVFEWNGSMLHAKTAVADARWARVGSTNLNLASWIGNRELDVVVENEAFGRHMEEMFQEDLGHATEIVLHRWARVRPAGNVRPPRVRGAGGSTTRAAAGVLRVGNALGSVLAARRVHGPAERWLMAEGGLLLAAHGRPRLPVAAPPGLATRRDQPVAGAGAPRPLRAAKDGHTARRRRTVPLAGTVRDRRRQRRQPHGRGTPRWRRGARPGQRRWSRGARGSVQSALGQAPLAVACYGDDRRSGGKVAMRFRVMTYNIHRAIGVDRRFRPERMGRISSSSQRRCQWKAIRRFFP